MKSDYAGIDFAFTGYTDIDFASTGYTDIDFASTGYTDIDFASPQKLEKSILKQDRTTSPVVVLKSKGAKGVGSNKNDEMIEDKSGYTMVCDVQWLLLYVDKYIRSLI